jgi:hypothetical protein
MLRWLLQTSDASLASTDFRILRWLLQTSDASLASRDFGCFAGFAGLSRPVELLMLRDRLEIEILLCILRTAVLEGLETEHIRSNFVPSGICSSYLS